MGSGPPNGSRTPGLLAANPEQLRHWLPLSKLLGSGPAASGTRHTPACALCMCARVERGSQGGQEGATKECPSAQPELYLLERVQRGTL